MRGTKVVAAAVALALVGLVAGDASAAVAPGNVTVKGTAGHTSTARFAVEATPAVDVELAFDTTASLGEMLAEAKKEVSGIVSEIQGRIPDARFAVAQFKDRGDTPEYRVEQAMTADGAQVEKAVSRLSAKGGGDLPEAYNLVFQRSYQPDVGGSIGWRAPARKIVVVVGDAEPHGAGTSGIEHCGDTSADPHGLDTSAVLSSLRATGRTLVMVHRMDHMGAMMGQMPAEFACYQGLAGAAGGVAVEGHQDMFRARVVGAVTDAVGPAPGGARALHVARATPAPASAAWVSVAPDASARAGSSFLVSVAVPPGTPSGTYVFTLAATAGASASGEATLTVKVAKPSCKKSAKATKTHAKAQCGSQHRSRH